MFVYVNFIPSTGLVAAGHSFIIDGYNEQGMVHVNWGWYGNYDGYFDIALLDVRGFQFNSYQDMVINFVPDSSQTELTGDVNNDGSVNIEDVTSLINYLLSGDSSQIQIANADIDGWRHHYLGCDGAHRYSPQLVFIKLIIMNPKSICPTLGVHFIVTRLLSGAVYLAPMAVFSGFNSPMGRPLVTDELRRMMSSMLSMTLTMKSPSFSASQTISI